MWPGVLSVFVCVCVVEAQVFGHQDKTGARSPNKYPHLAACTCDPKLLPYACVCVCVCAHWLGHPPHPPFPTRPIKADGFYTGQIDEVSTHPGAHTTIEEERRLKGYVRTGCVKL